MADIELVIKIDEEWLKDIKERIDNGCVDHEPWVAIANGTPLPKGHWIDGVCSECGYIGGEEVFGGEFKYCPVCGVKMEGEKNDE